MPNTAKKTAKALLALAVLCVQCQSDTKNNTGLHVVEPTLEAPKPLMRLLPPAQTGVDFQNHISETYEVNITTNINMYNGGGLAVIDVNNDNLPDLYFIGSSGPNGLYLNQGKLAFKNITDAAGVRSDDGFETAATAVDINGDGLLDLYVCRSGPKRENSRRNKLFVNNGDLTFTERAAEYGLDDESASTGANFFDFDNDGDLDLYLLNHPDDKTYTNTVESKLGPNNQYIPNLEPHKELDCDRFYRNDNGRFTDITKQAGIWNYGYGLSVSVSDLNRDGLPDVFVGNDFIQPDELYINNGNGTFTDQLGTYFRHTSQHTMGTDLNDFDNDGLIDLFAADMLGETNSRQKRYIAVNMQSNYSTLMKNGYFEPVVRNVLQRNNGNGTFSDIGCLAGVYKTDWSWSGLLFDMDNDGLRDLHVTNGYRRETNDRDFVDFTLPEIGKNAGSGKQLRDIYPDINDFLDAIPTTKLRNFVFANAGNWTFEPRAGQWMSMPGSWSCGAAWADLDADGDLDLVVNNLDDPAFIYENLAQNQPNSNFLQIKLQGAPPNTFAVGASTLIEYNNGAIQFYENYPTRGIFSSVEHLTHFGLGTATSVDRVTVRWPNGKTQTLANVPANQRLTLRQSDATGPYTPSIAPAPANIELFKDLTAASGLLFTHKENPFSDFDQFPLLPWTLSDMGPVITTGDVNGDGLPDLFVGNSFGQPAALFVQQPSGQFTSWKPDIWLAERGYEDHGAIFFDADGDGDQDLLVLSGGPEANPEAAAKAWENRLYINTDGKGTFGKAVGAIPNFGPNLFLRGTAFDYDGDGDQDLFLGGRLIPGKWPLTPRSAILRNDRNQLVDVTAQIAPDFERCGMVTDLLWANIDRDPEPELIVVGEWMPLTVFDWQQGKLVNASNAFGTAPSNGIWYRLAAGDLDGDGDIDLVTGNLGLNTRLTAQPNGPLKCYGADFDGNGTLDPILTVFEGDKEYPLYQKEVLHKQMPVLKKRLLYARDYGIATIDQVWPRKDLDAALNLEAYTLETSWWENKNGTLIRHALPLQAQMAPVQGIAIVDANRDGKPDILLVGNKYGFEVETNRCDSSNGCLLLGDGKGGFSWLDNTRHGVWASKEARDMCILQTRQRKLCVVANNNGPLQVYQMP
jgi:hypothetical protein